MLITIHILSGAVGLLSGATAFFTLKGANLHRRSGQLFVVSMILMAITGGIIAAFELEMLNMVAASLTLYLVISAFLTVKYANIGLGRRLNCVAMLLGLLVGIAGVFVGIGGLKTPDGMIDGQPAQVAIVFGSVALIAVLLDVRMMFFGGLQGKHRLLRHLWRMGFALFIAAASFFLGQSQIMPEPIRNLAVLSIPVFAVILLTLYWIVRVQFFQLRKQV